MESRFEEYAGLADRSHSQVAKRLFLAGSPDVDAVGKKRRKQSRPIRIPSPSDPPLVPPLDEVAPSPPSAPRLDASPPMAPRLDSSPPLAPHAYPYGLLPSLLQFSPHFLLPMLPAAATSPATPMSQQHQPAASSGASTSNSATPSRIFNLEAYCELCSKEFCNKYFLKTHKANRHGIYVKGGDTPPAANTPLPVDPVKLQATPESLVKFPCDACPKKFGSEYTLKRHRAKNHLPQPPEGYVSMERMERPPSVPSPPPLPPPPLQLQQQPSEAAETPATEASPLSPGRLRRLGVINADAFCEICSKEYCNKYFLKTHKLKRHGIRDPDDPHQKAFPLLQTSPLNLTISEQGMGSLSNGGDSHSHSHQEDEGLLAAYLQPKDEPEETRDLSEDLQKLQTMLLQLNALNGAAGATDAVFAPQAEQNGQALALSPPRAESAPLEGGESERKTPSSATYAEGPESMVEVVIKHEAADEVSEQPPQQQLKHEDLLENNGGPGIGANFLSSTSCYCDICNKELCNKYFKKVHMQKMHGIEIKDNALSGGVPCDICHKQLCSKYFVRVHKQNTHGIVDLSASPLPGSPQVAGASSSVGGAGGGAGGTPPPSGALDAVALKPQDGADLNHRYFAHFNVVCPLCSRRFRSAKWLRAHLVNDHAEQGLELARDLEPRPPPAPTHHPVDDGERSYHCSYCSFATPVLSLLFVHERSHAGLVRQAAPPPPPPPPAEPKKSDDAVWRSLRDAARESQVPATYAVPQAPPDKFIMQPFLLEEPPDDFSCQKDEVAGRLLSSGEGMACRATGLRAIELFRTDDFYICQSGEHSLWWDRNSATCTPKSGWDLVDAVNPECLGIFYGIIGKVEHNPGLSPRLLLIRSVDCIGELPGKHPAYKIKTVAFLNILGADVTQQELSLESCSKHCNRRQGEKCVLEQPQKTSLAKTWSSIKSATNTIKSTTVQAAQLAASQVKPLRRRDNRGENDKVEKRMLEELMKIWDDSNNFYFSTSGDLTNSQQRQWVIQQKEELTLQERPEYKAPPLYKKLDERFFWNRHMIQDIIIHDNAMAEFWILPVIQGFVQTEKCKVDLGRFDKTREAMEPVFETFVLTLISRRSRFRAGTRYNRRGVDESGKVANYVETEQIISYLDHQVSFVQVRGSVPVFWSQPGIKYRPPPRIDKGPAETRDAFEKHFNEELATYGHICIINLVEQTGREKIIADTYTENVCDFSCPDLTYCLFDFHEYCRGMHFENVSLLLNHILEVINEQKFCWLDKHGRICLQFGVFRVNCIDCLDRTNVVQTAIAKTVMEIVFTKLGLIAPEKAVPANIRNAFQVLWANNGDAISRQYAGTNALKGDYTRTGERKFSGLMKDSVNSASRYYQGRFRDAERQAAIDLMLGNPIPDEIFSGGDATFTEDITASAEQVKHVIEDSKKLLLPDPAECVGAWGLIDADQGSGNPTETDMDIILLLTRHFYCVAWYDDEADRVSFYQYVPLEDITQVEIGQCQLSSNSIFKTTKAPVSFCIRIYYQQRDDNGEMEQGFFHIFRSSNLRFFNNLAVAINSEDEATESIKYICEAFTGLKTDIPVQRVARLDRKKSKVPREIRGHQPSSSLLNLPTQIPRNFSDKSLTKVSNTMGLLKSEMSEKFSKITNIGTKKHDERVELTSAPRPKPVFVVGGDCEETSFFSAGSSLDLVDYPRVQPYRHPDCDQVSSQAGILMGSRKVAPGPMRPATAENTWLRPPSGRVLRHSRSDLSLSDSGRSPSRRTPEIMVHAAPEINERTPQNKAMLRIPIRAASSEHDISLNLSSSQSESALRSVRGFGSVLSSPSSMKDNALSRFAKGVQTFGANLDPRRLTKNNSPQGGQPVDPENVRQLQDKFKGCKTRLMAI